MKRTDDVIADRYLVVKGPVEDKSLRGGMGLVYLCADQAQDGRPVALKTFRSEYLPNRDARDQFLREGDRWMRLGRHPHIVRAHDVVRVGDGREVYVVLDLVAPAEGKRGASMRAWLQPGRSLDAQVALRFALEIARGMHHASERLPGLVHRDLKPENVLVGRDEMARVTDFGLAQVLADADVSTAEGVQDGADGMRHTQMCEGWVGTPPYMAPEQWDGGDVDLRADVYALGCVVVEMLTGEMPVQAKTWEKCRTLHRAGRALEAAAAVPPAARSWLRQCLAVRSEDRYRTWAEVEAGLMAVYAAVTGRPAPAAVSAAAATRDERVAAGWAQSEIGASYLDLGKAEVAGAYFERARAAGATEGEKRLEGAGLTHLGIAHKDLGDARRAIGYFEQALVIDREIGDRRGEGADLGNLGLAVARLGDVRRAIACHEQELVIAREIDDRPGEGDALNSLGNAHAAMGDDRRAIEYQEQALVIAREVDDRRGEGRALGNLGNAFLTLGDARGAIGYYEQALVVAREIGDRHDEGTALGSLGSGFLTLGDTPRAIGHCEQQLVITREIGDRRGEGTALGNLGSAFLTLGDTSRAIGYYEQQLGITRETSDRRGEAIASFNLAKLYGQQHEPQLARSHAETAARLFRAIGHAEFAEQADQLVQQLNRSSR